MKTTELGKSLLVIGLIGLVVTVIAFIIFPGYRAAIEGFIDLCVLANFNGLMMYTWEAMSENLGRKRLFLVRVLIYMGNLLLVVGSLSKILGLQLILERYVAPIVLLLLLPIALVGQYYRPLPSLRSLFGRKAGDS